MKTRNPATPVETRAALLAAFFVSVLVGCGDAHTFKVNPGPINPPHGDEDHLCFDGSEVKLVRYSSSCDKTSKSLDSVVQDGLVFPAEDVQTLEAPCADGPNPAIDLHFFIESHSVLLDFSKVVERGRFPSAEFDGYVLEVLLEESNGTLMSVEIDREATNLPLADEDVEWDRSHIDLNFEGVGYDEHSLLKLDLMFARVTPPM